MQVAASQVRLDVDQDAAQLAQISPGFVLEGDRPRLIDECNFMTGSIVSSSDGRLRIT